MQGSDGRWRALDATHIFREQVSFGTIYQAALRAEISRMYPHVRWGEVVRGQAEIEGTAELNAIFSRRTEQMQERLQKLAREWKVKHPGRRIHRARALAARAQGSQGLAPAEGPRARAAGDQGARAPTPPPSTASTISGGSSASSFTRRATRERALTV